MKLVKMTTILAVIFLMAMAIPGFAFHNGSQLICGNCHTMHYSEGGQIPSTANGYFQDADAGGPFPYLLLKANITDLCLQCHKDNGYAGAPSVYNTAAGTGIQLPGGDYGYGAKGTGGNAMTAPVGRGHNPFGDDAHPSVNFDKDVLNGSPDGMTPPGGTSLTDGEWVCTECHGVHGPESGNVNFYAVSTGAAPASYQSYGYRLLKATPNGYNTVATDSIQSHSYILSGGAVVAGPDGADLTVDESSTNHNVYKGGFSNWCSGCHPNFHGADESDPDVGNGTVFVRHPTDTPVSGLRQAISNGQPYNYNYPLVQVAGTWTNTGGGTISGSDKIMCLSCHKAHATANPDALRWDPTVASATEQCNKCHGFGGGV